MTWFISLLDHVRLPRPVTETINQRQYYHQGKTECLTWMVCHLNSLLYMTDPFNPISDLRFRYLPYVFYLYHTSIHFQNLTI